MAGENFFHRHDNAMKSVQNCECELQSDKAKYCECRQKDKTDSVDEYEGKRDDVAGENFFMDRIM